MNRLPLFLLMTAVTALPAWGGAKRPEKNRLTFHIQGNQADGPKMVFPVPIGNRQVFFSKTPVTLNKEILTLKHFQTKDSTFGATFSFNKTGAQRIAAITTSEREKWLVAMLNGRPVDLVHIDKPVLDGKLVIWQGITLSEIIRFEYAMPITGETQEQWKERIKGHEQQRKAAQKEMREAQKERNRRAQ
ncbi:MAG: hypothetical protein ACPGJR_14475 [Akkermansiaceae bacterium]